MAALDRPLGIAEQYFALGNEQGAFLSTTMSRLEGDLPPDVLERAVRWVQRRHPTLGMGLDLDADPPRLRPEPGRPVPFRVEPRAGEETWLEVARREIHLPLPGAEAPLWRVFYVHAPGAARSEIVLNYHHVAVDGGSFIRLVREVVGVCQRLLAGEALPDPEPLPLHDPVEDLIGSRSSTWVLLGQARRMLARKLSPLALVPFDAEAPAAERRQGFLVRSLEAAAVDPLKARAKAERAGLHGALCAAMLLAARARIPGGGKQVLQCTTAMDLRRYLTETPFAEHLGCFADTIDGVHRVRPDQPFWPLARACGRAVARGVASSAARHRIRTFAQYLTGEAGRQGIAELMEGRQGRRTTVLVNNMGKVDMPASERLRVVGLHGMANLDRFGPCLTLGSAALEGAMHLTFSWPEPTYERKTAEALVEDVLARLAAAGG